MKNIHKSFGDKEVLKGVDFGFAQVWGSCPSWENLCR